VVSPVHPLSPTLSDQQQIVDIGKDNINSEEMMIEKTSTAEIKKPQNYVSQSAVYLRCRVMPPPCIKNPYLMDASEVGIDPFGNQRSKCAGASLLVISEHDCIGTPKIVYPLFFV